MVREPDATMQPAPQDNQLMAKDRVLSFKPQLRLEWRGQEGQSETERPDHSASLGDSITSSTRIGFSVHTASPAAALVPAQSDLMACSKMRQSDAIGDSQEFQYLRLWASTRMRRARIAHSDRLDMHMPSRTEK